MQAVFIHIEPFMFVLIELQRFAFSFLWASILWVAFGEHALLVPGAIFPTTITIFMPIVFSPTVVLAISLTPILALHLVSDTMLFVLTHA